MIAEGGIVVLVLPLLILTVLSGGNIHLSMSALLVNLTIFATFQL